MGEGGEERKRIGDEGMVRWGVCCGSNIVGNGDTMVCKQDKMINH